MLRVVSSGDIVVVRHGVWHAAETGERDIPSRWTVDGEVDCDTPGWR